MRTMTTVNTLKRVEPGMMVKVVSLTSQVVGLIGKAMPLRKPYRIMVESDNGRVAIVKRSEIELLN